MGLGATLGALGCSSDPRHESSGSTAGTGDTTEGLSLAEATPERIVGTYTRGALRVSFVSEFSATTTSFVLKGAKGAALVSAGVENGARVMRLMDGRLTIDASGAQSGDATALADFITSQEAPVLPWLSRLLGSRGITGNDYPASFMIHSFAIVMSKAHGITLPPLAATQQTLGTRDTWGDTGGTCDDPTPDNDCLGMCGPGCSCWQWVCGDCCAHDGCIAHDEACRSCSWKDPGDCASCASFSAFFTGGGCAHP